MKRIVLSIVILTVLAGLCCWSVVAVNYRSDGFTEKIHEVEKAFEKNDTKKCVKAARELQDDWEGFMDHSILINDLGHALDITTSIAEIYSFAQSGNEELYAACDKAEVQIRIFKNMQLPTIWKVL